MAAIETTVVGIDGAHFELIQDWIDSGKLPEIAKVLDSGVQGDLKSVLPPVTSPNWKAYSTGMNPAKFGIYWWENIDTDGKRVYYPADRKNIRTEFWEVISENESVAILGVPTTYPPKDINGYIVSGAPDGKNTGFASPDDLEKELRNEFGYKVIKENSIKHNPDKAVDEILDLIDKRFLAAERLIDNTDISFLQVTTFYINSLHHYLWDDEQTLEAWKLIDQHIGSLRQKSKNLVLMSDHGSNKIQTSVYINTWLEKEGYLTIDDNYTSILYKAGIRLDTVEKIVELLGINHLTNQFPNKLKNLVKRLPDEAGSVNMEGKAALVDWDSTQAIASGQGPIYINEPEGSEEYNKVKSELIEKIGKLKSNGVNKVAKNVYEKDEIYSGKYLNDAPDLVIDQAPGVHIQGGLGKKQIFTSPEKDKWIAENKRSGLFAACGPEFSEGKIESISILDLAPTLLHLHGCPVLEEMDGKVRKTLFSDKSNLSRKEVQTTNIESLGPTNSDSGEEMDEEVKSRLDDLGYLS